MDAIRGGVSASGTPISRSGHTVGRRVNVWAGYHQRPRNGVDRRKTPKIVLFSFEIGRKDRAKLFTNSCSLKRTHRIAYVRIVDSPKTIYF